MLAWADNSANESGFTVERGEKTKGSVTYIRIAEVGPGVTSFTETRPSGTYRYRVRAFNLGTGGVSEYSNVVQVRIKANPGRNK